MSHPTNWLVLILGGGVLILSGSGCGGPGAASLSGNVTYEGKPLERGAIELAPADGKGPTIGSTIIAGQYKIAKLNPGTYKVTIAMLPYAAGGRMENGDDLSSRSTTDKNQMPAEAGHNLTVNANPGENTQDFPLKRPAK